MSIYVLLVDDELALLDQAKIFLEREEEKLDVTTVQSPTKGLELLEKRDFEVIVSDYQMPGMDGLEFLEVVREEREIEVPFIIFTGKGREEVAMKALNLGADRYIKKEGNPKDQFEYLANAIVRENDQYDVYREKEEREKKIKKLYEASIELSSYDSEEEIYRQVLDSFESILDFGASSICMAGDGCLVVQATDAKNVEEGEERSNDEGIRGLTYQNKESYLIDDLSEWEESEPSDPDFKSVLSIPIEDEGVFQALSYEKNYFEEFGLEMSELLISHMWEVVKGIRYRDELERNETWLSQIIVNSSIPTFVIDEEHRVTHWNKACENLTDVSEETVIDTRQAWKGFYDEERPVMADLVLGGASEEEIMEHYGDKFSGSDLLEEAYEAVDFFSEFGEEGLWVYFTAAPIKDSEGKRVGAIETLQDITERKEKEEELKENEEKYRAIFESANDAIFVMKDGKFVDCNEKTLEMFECSRDEMIGEPPFEFSPEEQPDGRNSKEKAREKIDSALEGEPQSFGWVHTTKDGDPFHTQVTLNRYEVDGEKFVIAVIRDISEQKEAEKALQEAKQNYEELFAKSADALYVLDPDTAEILDVNQKVCEMYGYSREEAFELPIEDLSSGEHPYTQEEAQKRVQKAKEDGPITFEWRGQKKDGTLIWEEVTLKEAEIGGESRVLASVRDISERKKVQRHIETNKEKLERLHQISANLETCQSEDEIYSYALEAAEEILEFDLCSFDAVEGDQFVIKALSSDVPERGSIERKIEDGGLDKKTYLNQKSYLVDDLNEEEDAKPVKSEYRSAISVPIGEFGLFQAVSTEKGYFDEEDLKMAELLMDHVKEALKRVEMEQREEFLHSLLRHDVQNKTQIVKGYLELLEEDEDFSDDGRVYLQESKKAINASDDIIEKVRKLRRIEQEDEIGELEIDPVLDQILSEYKSQLEKQGIDIEIEETGCIVKGGPLLEEMFSNLLENSILHSDCDKIRIRGECEGNECVVTVEDDGKGIPDDVKEQIFERGFKEGEDAGSGLGMYLVKEIAESYGGSVEVKDPELGGARFDIRLQRV
ncbi:MAG: PAS domain S-box protein [Thermoplasmata archaeon]